MIKLTKEQRKVINIATVIAVIVAGLILAQFASAIIAGCIAAFVFIPLKNWLSEKTGRDGMAVTLTTIISIFTIVIPVILVVWVSVNQVQNMINDVQGLIDSDELYLSGDKVLDRLNEFLGSISGGAINITVEQVQDYALNAAKAIGEGMLSFLTATVGSLPRLITNIIIFFYVFIGLLGNYKSLLGFVTKLNPLGNDATNLYLNRSGAMTSGMVKGQFIVAIAQGIIGAVSLHLAGLNYFAFFALLLSVLSIIPLGGGIITIPIGFIMLLAGNIFGGLIVLITHFLVVTNIDNYLRPKLVPKSIELHPAFTMISVLGGLAIFGFLGIVVGPVLFILALTTIQMYVKFTDNKISE